MPDLTVKRAEAERQLTDRIEKGQELLAEEIPSKAALEDARARYHTWTEYNEALLKKLFTSADEAETYAEFVGIAFGGAADLARDILDHHDDIKSKIRRLTSVVERLELFDEPSETASAPDD